MNKPVLRAHGLELHNHLAKLKVDRWGILQHVTSLAIGIKSGEISGLVSTLFDLFGSVTFEDDIQTRGWRLISHSLMDSLATLITEPGFYLRDDIDVRVLDSQLDDFLNNNPVMLTNELFNKPKEIPFLKDIQPVITGYLECFGLEHQEVINILERLNGYFAISLKKEWSKAPEYYNKLGEYLNTPFDGAERKEIEWNVYLGDLQKEILKPVFSESFSLQQVYIPLRACYKEKSLEKKRNAYHEPEKDEKVKEIVVDLESYLMDWIKKGDAKDAIRIIRGGPGYGKSSCLKMLAARLAEENKRVLFIPLHRFEVGAKLDEAIADFLKYDRYFTHDIIHDYDERLILIFDGLDELAMQGRHLAEIAQSFLREVERSVSNFNTKSLRLQVVLSGRDVIVQQNESDFRQEGQILKLLPYYIPEEDKENLKDEKNLLEQDQRNDWWGKYARLKGKEYSGLPESLKTKELDEITAQPLLNFLVALSYERGKIDFNENTNLNEVYADLLDAVQQRKYSYTSIHSITKKISLEDFCIVLEEIALSAWHGKGRTTTVDEINEHFKRSGLDCLLENFIADAKQGVMSLLVAFYFRQVEQTHNGSQTFEFTHKSFGEYLAAKKIVRRLSELAEELSIYENSRARSKGMNVKRCLEEWLLVLGPKNLELDTIRFIRNEMRLIGKVEPKELFLMQKVIVKFFNYMLIEGMPVEKLQLSTYKQANEYAINAERALFILHSLLAEITEQVSDIDWADEYSFGKMLDRLGEKTEYEDLAWYLNHLNLGNSCLKLQNLFFGRFINSNLFGSNLNKADLSQAIFRNVNLSNAFLNEANLSGADLSNVNFNETFLEWTNLNRAILSNCSMINAYLNGANLRNTRLMNTDLRYADLRGADLRGAKFNNVDLWGADLTNADFRGADLNNVIMGENTWEESIEIELELED